MFVLVSSLNSNVLNGSAVCVYRMQDIIRAFKGNFLHREGQQYKWTEYAGRVPYPRPGTVSLLKSHNYFHVMADIQNLYYFV